MSPPPEDMSDVDSGEEEEEEHSDMELDCGGSDDDSGEPGSGGGGRGRARRGGKRRSSGPSGGRGSKCSWLPTEDTLLTRCAHEGPIGSDSGWAGGGPA